MVELARLERVYGSNVIQGSNPCLSAKLKRPTEVGLFSLLERLGLIERSIAVAISGRYMQNPTGYSDKLKRPAGEKL